MSSGSLVTERRSQQALQCIAVSFTHLDISPYAYLAYLSDSYMTDTVLKLDSAMAGHGFICETCSLVQGLDNDGPSFWPRLKAVTYGKPHLLSGPLSIKCLVPAINGSSGDGRKGKS